MPRLTDCNHAKLLLFLPITVIFTGCLSDSNPEGGSCTSADDCLAGQTCVDSNCIVEADSGGPDGGDVPEPAGAILIVTPDQFAQVAGEHALYREAQGHVVEVLSLATLWSDSPPSDRDGAVATIRDAIFARYVQREVDPDLPFFVLLLGDDGESWDGIEPVLPAGSYFSPWHDEEIPSDNVYADIDGDDAPDLAVGRIPAQTVAEVELVLNRVRDYENTVVTGTARRRLDLFAGEPGMGEDIDAALEMAFYEAVEDFSYSYDVTMTYANTSNPYGYVDSLISDRIYEILAAGPLMSAYVGHGGSGGIGILDDDQIDAKLRCPAGSPLMLSIACSTGSFDRDRCLAERLLLADQGPIMVFAATAISHPAHNAELLYGNGDGLLNLNLPTIGELTNHAEREMMLNEAGFYDFIITVAVLFEEAEDLEILNPAHAHMYTLFGDPATRIAYPSHLAEFEVAESPRRVGQPLTVSGCADTQMSGTALVTLESQRSAILGDLLPVPEESGPARDAAIVANNQTANNRVVSSVEVEMLDGCFDAELPVPDETPSARFWIKAYTADGSHDAIGSIEISIAPAND